MIASTWRTSIRIWATEFRVAGKMETKTLTLFKFNTGKHRQFVAQSQADEDPVLKRGAQFVFTFTQRFAECDYALKFGNLTRKGAVFEFVISRRLKSRFDVTPSAETSCRQNRRFSGGNTPPEVEIRPFSAYRLLYSRWRNGLN